MTNPAKRDPQVAHFPESAVNPAGAGPETVSEGTRVESGDYGPGTVVADVGIGIQVWWDRTLPGTHDMHLLTHDRAWVEKLKRL